MFIWAVIRFIGSGDRERHDGRGFIMARPSSIGGLRTGEKILKFLRDGGGEGTAHRRSYQQCPTAGRCKLPDVA
jgi:hypothetical protein